jgi:hypothetical protein
MEFTKYLILLFFCFCYNLYSLSPEELSESNHEKFYQKALDMYLANVDPAKALESWNYLYNVHQTASKLSSDYAYIAEIEKQVSFYLFDYENLDSLFNALKNADLPEKQRVIADDFLSFYHNNKSDLSKSDKEISESHRFVCSKKTNKRKSNFSFFNSSISKRGDKIEGEAKVTTKDEKNKNHDYSNTNNNQNSKSSSETQASAGGTYTYESDDGKSSFFCMEKDQLTQMEIKKLLLELS